MLWVDKHRPKNLDQVDYHREQAARLQAMARTGEIPHLLFHGPSGAGKKTRVMALLRELYGGGAEKLRLEHRTFKTPSNKTIELTTVASNFHIEMNPGDAGIYDRFIVQEIIKEIASSNPLQASGGQAGFKIVILTEVDRLTQPAQAALRRTMEKYVRSCRLILCCNSPSKVIDPVRSRCLAMRIAAPTHDQTCAVLQSVCNKEGLSLPQGLATRIAQQSGRNLRRAVLMLEASKTQQYPFSDDQDVQLPDWEMYIAALAREITQEQSPQRLLQARTKLYELLANCIPADIIIKTLMKELMKVLDDELKHEVARWAAHYEHRLACGSKDIFHLEAFVAKFMSIYKRYLINMFG